MDKWYTVQWEHPENGWINHWQHTMTLEQAKAEVLRDQAYFYPRITIRLVECRTIETAQGKHPE